MAKESLSMKRIITFILILITTQFLFSTTPNKQIIVPSNDSLYDYIELLNLESGNINLILSRPSTVAELQVYLSTIDTTQLSSQGLKLYNRLEEELNKIIKNHDWVIYEPGLEVNLETYLHTNSTTSWLYNNNDRLPLINVPNTIYLMDNFLFHADVDVRKDIYVSNLESNYTNLLLDLEQLSTLMPHRGYVNAGGENWHFSIGKDKNSWGNGQYSNFMISDAAPYHDTVQTSYFDQYSKTTFLLMSMSPHYVDENGDTQEWGNDAGEYPGKYLLAHRTEVSLFDSLRLGISESLLVFNTPLDLRFFNPANMYHNFFMSENATSFIQVDLNLRLLRHWDLYYQIGFNQIQLPYENERYVGAEDIPGGMGHILGIRANYPLSEGFLTGGYEFTYTSPWMYINSWDQTNSLNYNWSAIILSNHLGSRKTYFAPLGHSAGNDSILHFFTLDYIVPFKWQVGFEALLHYNGELTLTSMQERGPDAVLASSPTGTAETLLALSLKGKMQIFDELGLYSQVSFVTVTNQENIQSNSQTDFQFVLGLSYTPEFK